MAKVKVHVVHDAAGRIVSISLPSNDAKVIVLSGDGQAVFETEVEEERISEMVGGGYRADADQNSVVETGTGKG